MRNTTSTTVNRTLRRLPNSAYRVREYLTEKEVDRLIEAARNRGRNGARDAAAILLAYRHGLRASELCALRWSQIDLRNSRLHVNRAKGGIESVHPLHGRELRALRPLQGSGPYVFVTEAGTPVTPAWFLRMIQRTGVAARLAFPVHPHMLRISSLTMGKILGRLLIISVTEIYNQRPDTLRLRLIGLRVSGRTSVCESPWRLGAPGAL